MIKITNAYNYISIKWTNLQLRLVCVKDEANIDTNIIDIGDSKALKVRLSFKNTF